MSKKPYLAGFFLLLLTPSFAMAETWRKDENWEKSYRETVYRAKEPAPCVPAYSKKAYSPGDVPCGDDLLPKKYERLLQELRGLNLVLELNSTDYCHKKTSDERAFNDCVAANKRVISEKFGQPLKKALTPNEEKGVMPSLDAMGYTTGAE